METSQAVLQSARRALRAPRASSGRRPVRRTSWFGAMSTTPCAGAKASASTTCSSSAATSSPARWRSSPTRLLSPFGDLDNRANQVARYLIEQGITSGDRVGLLFDRTVDSYVALLAVLKVNAAYVPLDAGFPTERIRFILQDAGVKAVDLAVELPSEARRVRRPADPARRRRARHRRKAEHPPHRRREGAAGRSALPTSSTPRERPATPRAWSSSTRASAISSRWRPSSTASAPAIASTRA